MFSLGHQLQKEIKWNIGTLFNNESLAFSSSVDYVSKNVNMLKKKKTAECQHAPVPLASCCVISNKLWPSLCLRW